MSFYTGTQAEAYYSLANAVGTVGPSATNLIATAPSTAPRCIIPALFFSYLASSGKTLKFNARGTYTSSAATPPTFTAGMYLNPTPGTVGTNILCAFATTAQPAASITAGWTLEGDIVCSNASATSLTLQTNTRFELQCVAQNAATPVPATLATLPAFQVSNNKVTSGISSEAQYELAIQVLQSAATAGNSINVQQFIVLGIN
jgi:hypothetical protein